MIRLTSRLKETSAAPFAPATESFGKVVSGLVKRAFDIVASLIGLILLPCRCRCRRPRW